MRRDASPPASQTSPCVCGRLRRAARALTQLYDDTMAPTGLRVTQFSLLSTLLRQGPVRITELAALALLDRTALSRNLDPLVALGLVRVAPGRDARTREVALTPAGKSACERARPYWRRAQAEVAQRIGAPRIDALVSVLASLEALHPETAKAVADPASARASSAVVDRASARRRMAAD